MSAFDASTGLVAGGSSHAASAFRPGKAGVRWLGTAALGFGTFLAGFVIAEPAPYELYFALLIPVWFLFGLKLSRTTGVLTALFATYMVGGFLALTQLRQLESTPMYMAVSLFLCVSAIFFAAVIEADYARLGTIMRAWVAAAVITATLGILGYFKAFPGAEIFTRYDRAMGAFQDPNVFGPFLIAPSLFLVHGILMGNLRQILIKGGLLMIIVFGLLLSFSRAAWGLFGLSAAFFVLLMVIRDRTGAFRLKVTVLVLVGVMVMLVGLLVALQFDSVTSMFETRTKLVQEYDGARLGRFERHKIGFLMSMEHPFGIGPMVFSKIFPEDEHNIWLKNLTSYGWLGFVVYLGMLWSALYLGLKYMFRERPWQPILMIAWVVVLGHAAIGNVIDTDHWRHHYLLFGIIWGCIALEHRYQKGLLVLHRKTI